MRIFKLHLILLFFLSNFDLDAQSLEIGDKARASLQ